MAQADVLLDAAIPGYKTSDGKGGEKPSQLDVTTQGRVMMACDPQFMFARVMTSECHANGIPRVVARTHALRPHAHWQPEFHVETQEMLSRLHQVELT